MKLKVEGVFKDKQEFDLMREKTIALLTQFGFTDVRAHEDLISNEWTFFAKVDEK